MASDAPADRLTIAEFTDNYGPRASGLLYAVQFLEEQVLAAGHKVWLIAPESDGPNPLATNESRREIRLPSMMVPGTHIRMALGKDFDYRLAQMVANPPDVIHVHGLGTIGLLGMWLSQRTGRPLVVTWHTDFEAYAEHYWHLAPMLNAAYKVFRLRVQRNWRELRFPRFTRPRRGKAQLELLGLCAEMLADADLVASPSDKTARRVLELSPTAKVRVVPSGADPLPEREPVLRAKGPRLLYVGRISAEKNIGLLLDAFERVRDHLPDVELMIVGDWKNAGAGLRLRLQSAAHFGGVKLVGQIDHDDLSAYYASADVFVYPSLTDTQALVLHEAAHAGLPIVMVDDELRLVVDPGVNALVARPNPVYLARAIMDMLRALGNPDFAAAAHARSKELAAQWTVANQSREIIDIYEALAAGRPVELSTDLRVSPQRSPATLLGSVQRRP
ncbi:MAG: glycosyltransferase [Propionibacteriaceae bacterium]|jgi:glycosyltransferase involved in cell wall biosynthesis|nr:glycosyltransferase [Propionibacteriaceae bacterium]